MARSAVSLTDISRAGAAVTLLSSDPTNGNYLDDPGRCLLFVRNSGGASEWIEFEFARTFDGNVVTPKRITMPASQVRWFAGWSPALYFQPSDSGRLWINTQSTNIKVQAFRLPPRQD